MADDPRGHGAKGRHVREQAVAALLSERTVAAAAQKAGIGLRTLQRWLQQSGFQALYREARHRALEQSLARLQVLTGGAVSALDGALQSPDDRVRVRAALGVLAQAVHAAQQFDLAERLDALEARLHEPASTRRTTQATA